MIGFFQSVLHSWKASLTLLMRSLDQVFWLALKSTAEIYSTLFMYAWWVVALLVLSFFISPGASSILQTLLFFVVLCAVRSSVGLKNTAYFIEKITYFFVPYWFVTFLVMHGLSILNPFFLKTGGAFLVQVMALHCSAFLTLFGLFLIDSGFFFSSLIESPLRALRMLVYNYPAFLLIECFRLLIGVLSAYAVCMMLDTSSLTFFWSMMIDLGLWFLYIPFYVALVTIVYLRRVYEQAKYY